MALIPPAVVQQKYGIPTSMLAQWRRQGTGPEYFILGPRSIRYYPADIDDWLTRQNQHPGGHVEKARKHMIQDVPSGKSGGSNALFRWNG